MSVIGCGAASFLCSPAALIGEQQTQPARPGPGRRWAVALSIVVPRWTWSVTTLVPLPDQVSVWPSNAHLFAGAEDDQLDGCLAAAFEDLGQRLQQDVDALLLLQPPDEAEQRRLRLNLCITGARFAEADSTLRGWGKNTASPLHELEALHWGSRAVQLGSLEEASRKRQAYAVESAGCTAGVQRLVAWSTRPKAASPRASAFADWSTKDKGSTILVVSSC